MKSVGSEAVSSVGKKNSSTGKKLVQARLPFKTLSSPSSVDVQPKLEIKKRKLSYSKDEDCTRNINTSISKNDKEVESVISIISDGEVDNSEIEENIENLKDFDGNDTLKSLERQPTQVSKTTIKNSTSSKVSQNREKEKLKIKLPLSSNKKKRKLSKQIDDDVVITTGVNDVVESKKSNPIKKIKLDAEQNQELDLNDTPNEDDNKVKNLIENSPEKIEEKESNEDSSIEKVSIDTAKEDAIDLVGNDDSEMENISKNKLPKNGKGFRKSVTPKSSKNIQELEKKQLAKELREKKIQEEKEMKRQEKEEKERHRKFEKEQKEEQRRKEREEKEKKRLAEIEAKNEEKKMKEDERKKREEIKDEEKRKKDEEKRRKEMEKDEAEQKRKKAAEAFTRFFVPKRGSSKGLEQYQSSEKDSNEHVQKNTNFMPFQIKGDMKLAPIHRKMLENDKKRILESYIIDQNSNRSKTTELYLNLLRNGVICAGKYPSTWLKDDDADSLIVIEDELEGAGQSINDTSKIIQKMHAKYFLFHENQRPPYFGTWRKSSTVVKPRRPFAKDLKYCDYEIDSDDEWEEEEPGESLHGSDDEKESEDEYEVDNEFFVPHGHLSDEELQNEDELEDNSPETQKAKLKILQQEFANEMKKKTEKIKPRLVGIVWQTAEHGNQPENCPNVIWQSLNKRAMIYSEAIEFPEPEKLDNSALLEKKIQKRTKLTDDLVKDLIRLIHGNRHNKNFLIREFLTYLAKKFESEPSEAEYTKVSIKTKILKIANWQLTRNETQKKNYLCWVVSPETFKRYGIENSGIVNNWRYILKPHRHSMEGGNLTQQQPQEIETANNREMAKVKKPIKMFTKLISPEGKPRHNTSISMNSSEKANVADIKMLGANKVGSDQNKKSQAVIKKRVPILMSVPRGQEISQRSKDVLISNFLKSEVSGQIESLPSEKMEPIMDSTKIVISPDSVITID